MISKDPTRHVEAGGVQEYIDKCPSDVQPKLQEVRKVIQAVAPDAIETVSYFDMPGYAYEGYDYNGMFVWFSYKAPMIRLHVRPPVIDNHPNELIGVKKTKSIVSFDEKREMPLSLIKKLVRASLAEMKSREL